MRLRIGETVAVVPFQKRLHQLFFRHSACLGVGHGYRTGTVFLAGFVDHAILGFLAKLKITDRWLKLDPATGRKLFRRFTEEVRATFKGVDFEG